MLTKNSNIISKNKYMILIVSIILGGLLMTSVTYAYLTYTADVTNGNYAGTSTCLNVIYDRGDDITGTLLPSSTPKGGLSGGVTISRSSTCVADAKGRIILNIDNTVDGFSTLTQTVGGHCENYNTLETYASATNSVSCGAQTNGTWVTDGTALKYAVYQDGVLRSVGYIRNTDEITVYEDFWILTTSRQYDIYIWLDGNVSDNSYQDIGFDGVINTEVVQSEEFRDD